ncbi:Oxidoreductase lepF [Fusarium oxysporum f. sp. cubense]|uniref:Oxidoreductase lepF n=1 Tax=Fusarium oxysporum f. sp. cubense TaxID=61366 RepID=A0A559LMH8_FUSOC|nr:Oxidoreductase lepF [Fusarium oxysporum f. sp. cubense]
MSSSHPAPQSFVAVFVGATRGIGLATLKALTRTLPNPRFYIIGRSKARFAGELALLNEYNPNAAIQFVEAEVSLIKGIDGVCERIMNLEKHVDLLFMSPGSLAFGGPHYTGEKLDLCFALSFYIRMRLIERLLPMLMQAPHPRVLSVLAGGHEGPLFTNDGDIGLRKKGNYTAPRAVNQVTTLHSLVFMYLASHYPKLSWLHVHPGWVATTFLSDLLQSAGIVGVLAGKIALPVYRFIAMSEEECGRRQAEYALSGRYPSREMICSAVVDVTDQAACYGSCSGFYRVLSDGSTDTDGKVLGPMEREGWPLEVFEHIQKVFGEILSQK